MCRGVDYSQLVVTTFFSRTQQLGLQTLGKKIPYFREAWGRDDVWGWRWWKGAVVQTSILTVNIYPPTPSCTPQLSLCTLPFPTELKTES